MDVISKIIHLRKQKGYSVYKLAKLAGISQSFLREVEIGQKQPSVSILDKICSALGLTLAEFFIEDSGQIQLRDSLKPLIKALQNLPETQFAAVQNIIFEFTSINKQMSHYNRDKADKNLTYELLDLLDEKSNPSITIAGKPISIQERIKILEALKEILSSCNEKAAAGIDDEVLAASFQGELVHIPAPEEAEDIQNAIEFALVQKVKDSNKKEKL